MMVMVRICAGGAGDAGRNVRKEKNFFGFWLLAFGFFVPIYLT